MTSIFDPNIFDTKIFDAKWKKEPHHTKFVELCPYCHNNLKNHVYATENGFRGKIFRCEHCYGLLKLGEGNRWVAVEKEWASDW